MSTVFVIALVIALFIAVNLGYQYLVLEPQRQDAYNGMVQGIIADYCAAPRPDDKAASRVQLANAIAGQPDRYSKIPPALQVRATSVRSGQAGAC